MKIEIDLLRMDQDTFKARCCAVALLSALPWDEAQAAVDEWRAVRQERLRGDDEPSAAAQEAADVKAVTAVHAYLQAEPGSAAEAAAKVAAEAARTVAARDEPGQRECEACGGKVSRPGDLLCDACMAKAQPVPRRVPDYKVGGWVVTDLGEVACITAIVEGDTGWFVKVAIDDGEQTPTWKLIEVARVRPATTAEISAAAALPEGPGGPEKKKRGRPKKAPADAVSEELTKGAEEVTQRVGNGGLATSAAAEEKIQAENVKAAKYAKTSLRDLCKLAAHHAGRNKVMAALTREGVDELAGLAPDKEAAVRASVLELVP